MFYTTLGFGSPTLMWLGPVAGVLLVLLMIACLAGNLHQLWKGRRNHD